MEPEKTVAPATTEWLARVCGTSLPPERLAEVLAAYAGIFEEIAKLKTLDLADVHPAIVFEPTAAYRRSAR